MDVAAVQRVRYGGARRAGSLSQLALGQAPYAHGTAQRHRVYPNAVGRCGDCSLTDEFDAPMSLTTGAWLLACEQPPAASAEAR